MRALVLALLVLFPRTPAAVCLRARLDHIATAGDAAVVATGVPGSVLAAVGWMESHLGCAPRSGGCWGAPIDRRHRGTPGGALEAARALARGREVCGDWSGAVARFRGGLCTGHRAYVGRVMRLAERLGGVQGDH